MLRQVVQLAQQKREEEDLQDVKDKSENPPPQGGRSKTCHFKDEAKVSRDAVKSKRCRRLSHAQRDQRCLGALLESHSGAAQSRGSEKSQNSPNNGLLLYRGADGPRSLSLRMMTIPRRATPAGSPHRHPRSHGSGIVRGCELTL